LIIILHRRQDPLDELGRRGGMFACDQQARNQKESENGREGIEWRLDTAHLDTTAIPVLSESWRSGVALRILATLWATGNCG
jgi:hypothetical protein